MSIFGDAKSSKIFDMGLSEKGGYGGTDKMVV